MAEQSESRSLSQADARLILENVITEVQTLQSLLGGTSDNLGAGSSTSVPQASTSVPHASTSVPHASTSVPHASTSVPHASTSVPHASTSVPHASTSVPYASSYNLTGPLGSTLNRNATVPLDRVSTNSRLTPPQPPLLSLAVNRVNVGNGGKRSWHMKSGPLAKRTKENTTEFVILEILLLPKKNVVSVPSGEFYKYLSENKCISRGCTFQHNMSEVEVRSTIIREFSPLLNETGFRFFTQSNKVLLPVDISQDKELNGKLLSACFRKKKLFICPDVDLPIPPFSSKKKSRTHHHESEEDEDIDEPVPTIETVLSPTVETVPSPTIETVPSPTVETVPTSDIVPTINTDTVMETRATSVLMHNAPKEYLQKLLKQLLLTLNKQLSTKEFCRWIIDRRYAFRNAIRCMSRRSFNILHPLKITFTDTIGTVEDTELLPLQEGVDGGGLRRNFFLTIFRILKGESKLFAGVGEEKYLTYYGPGFNGNCNQYEVAGRLMAMSLVQKGPGPNFFSKTLYDSVISGCIDVSEEWIVDPAIIHSLNQIKNATHVEDLRAAVLEDPCLDAKLTTFPEKLEDKAELIQQLLVYHGKIKIMPVLESLRKGLKTYGLLTCMESHPSLFTQAFCIPNDPLTAENVMRFFIIERQPKGSHKFCVENEVIQMFNDFLVECEEGTAVLKQDEDKTPATLGDVLEFATGSDSIPPLGFDTQAKIKFLHECPLEKFPRANACVVTLYLPVAHSDNDSFNEHLIAAVKKTKNFDIA